MLNSAIISFLVYLSLSVFIGLLSARKSRGNVEDYFLGSRSIGPTFVALSAVASNNSGFMFIGIIGAAYTVGISTIWVMVGWVFGDFLAWFFIHRSLRELFEKRTALSFSSFIGSSKHSKSKLLSAVSAIIIIIFLGIYAAAQFKAGSKALHVLFGWDYFTGALIGAFIVGAYCLAGGIRASIWTDVFQSFVMMFSMFFLLVFSIINIGGISTLWKSLFDIDPTLIDIFPPDLKFGFLLYLIGWLTAGLGVVGQPHIMIRAMAIRSAKELKKSRNIYFIWNALFACFSIGVGLCCRVLIPELADFDPELALPKLSNLLLPQVFTGIILAGLFSATMSTADSQILSCSSSFAFDIYPFKTPNTYLLAKVATILVTFLALIIALFGGQSVFTLVVFSWSGLASTIGPLIVIRTFNKFIHPYIGIFCIFNAIATLLLWRFVFQFSDSIYEVLPGVIINFVTYFLLSSLLPKKITQEKSGTKM